MKVEIKRWDRKKLAWQIQKRIVRDVISICAEDDHKDCKHDKGDIVLRSHEITSVSFYPNLGTINVYTYPRQGKGGAR